MSGNDSKIDESEQVLNEMCEKLMQIITATEDIRFQGEFIQRMNANSLPGALKNMNDSLNSEVFSRERNKKNRKRKMQSCEFELKESVNISEAQSKLPQILDAKKSSISLELQRDLEELARY